MFRTRICRLLILSVAASAMAAPPITASAHDTDFVYRFEGGGWGHGVGMSQYGALGRAEAGDSAEQILEFYYDGTTIGSAPEGITDLRIRLSPTKYAAPPTAATVTPQTGTTIDVAVGDDEFLDLDGPVTAELLTVEGFPIVNDPNHVYDDIYRWRVTSGGAVLCDSCEGATVEMTRTAETTITVADNLYPHETSSHDAGNVQLRPYLNGLVVLMVDVPLETYLEGIREVPSSWPAEAVQAQVIAARSYAVAQAAWRSKLVPSDPEDESSPLVTNWRWDLWDDTWDQVYKGAAGKTTAHNDAVAATDGQVLIHGGKTIRAFYTSSNGGHTAASEESFAAAEPYHIAKPDPFDPARNSDGEPQNPYWKWTREFTVTELEPWLKNSGSTAGDGELLRITITEVPPSGRVDDATVEITWSEEHESVTTTGSQLRKVINSGAPTCTGSNEPDCELRSTNFRIVAFFDIESGDFFYFPVIWMSNERITNGVGPNEFGPGIATTRAEVATFIWRFMSEPEPIAKSGFEDVAPGSWYDDPVSWMKENRITAGTSPTEFTPHRTVTRGEIATFLYRLAGEPPVTASDQFADVPEGQIFTKAVAWMTEHDITKGTGPATFSPGDPVTRGQVAAFLYRLAGNPEAFAEGTDLPTKMRAL